MIINFQPKIIIGSLVGFIATAIGVIAVFFPSIFNLEKKSIDEYSIQLKTCNNAENLFNFLKNHQDKIVRLNISYVNGNLYNKFGEKIEEVSEYKNEEGHEQNKNEGMGIYGKDGITLFGDNKLFSVVSNYRRDPHGEWIYREEGGIGLWCKNEKTSSENNKYFDLAFQLIIPAASNGSKLYKWGSDPEDVIADTYDYMDHLSGVFYVHKLQKAHEYGQKESVMHPQYAQEFQWKYGEWLAAPEIFELEPMTKKDIEMKDY